MNDTLSSASAIALSGFLVSLLAALILSRASVLTSMGLDRATGVQKFHVRPTSRLGGIAIGLGIGSCLVQVDDPSALTLAACAMPVFAGGLIEDLTHRVGSTSRLILAIISASAGYFLLGIGVHHTDVWPVDKLLELPPAAYLVTMLVVAGFTNGVNIIDGFHGLAAGTAVIITTCLLVMASEVEDALMVRLFGLSIACIAGFLALNWPRGKIFLGDAGAYFIGFWVVELGLLLVIRNPSISPMAPVVAGIFPLIETLFSMYRRKWVRNHPVNHPDALHLHTLVYRRLVFSPHKYQSHELKNQANARVAWYFWLPASAFGALSVVFQTDTTVLLILMLAYLGLYLWLYRRLVKFSSPRWMRLRR